MGDNGIGANSPENKKSSGKKIVLAIGIVLGALLLMVCAILFINRGKRVENENGSMIMDDYDNIRYEQAEEAVTDEAIEEELKNLAEQYAEKVDLDKEKAEIGDSIEIKYVGKKDGKEFEGGTSESYELKLGSGVLIDGFEDGIVGMKVGETKVLNLEFSEEYNAELAGPVEFTVTLVRIFEFKPVDIDDDLAKLLGLSSLEELKAQLKKELAEINAEGAEYNNIENALKAAIKKADIQVKAEALEKRYKENLELYESYAELFDQSMEEFSKTMGFDSYEAMCDDLKKNTEEQLKLEIFVKEYAKAKNIKVTDEEYQAYLDKIVEEYGGTPESVEESFTKEEVEYLATQVKVAKHLMGEEDKTDKK